MARKVSIYTFSLDDPSLLSTITDYIVSRSRKDVLVEMS